METSLVCRVLTAVRRRLTFRNRFIGTKDHFSRQLRAYSVEVVSKPHLTPDIGVAGLLKMLT